MRYFNLVTRFDHWDPQSKRFPIKIYYNVTTSGKLSTYFGSITKPQKLFQQLRRPDVTMALRHSFNRVPSSRPLKGRWVHHVNPLECDSATSNNMKLVHWPLMGRLLHLVQRWGSGQGRSPPRPLLAVRHVTVHPSTASVPITVLLIGPLLCGCNVPIKGLNWEYA